MKRQDLEHIIRAAAEITDEYEFVIVGSQSILGGIPYPPAVFTVSSEADIYPLNAFEKADQIDAAIGEGSAFHDTHGYYAQGVGPETACLPEGWLDRVERIQNQGTNGRVAYCLGVLDLFMAKAVADRDKDRDFDVALLTYGYVKADEAIAMVDRMPIDSASKGRLRARIKRWIKVADDQRRADNPDASVAKE